LSFPLPEVQAEDTESIGVNWKSIELNGGRGSHDNHSQVPLLQKAVSVSLVQWCICASPRRSIGQRMAPWALSQAQGRWQSRPGPSPAAPCHGLLHGLLLLNRSSSGPCCSALTSMVANHIPVVTCRSLAGSVQPLFCSNFLQPLWDSVQRLSRLDAGGKLGGVRPSFCSAAGGPALSLSRLQANAVQYGGKWLITSFLVLPSPALLRPFTLRMRRGHQ
jgi:hypothetical protein